uniref:Large ribosomal subunit protein eL28 n=1 Tax=Sphaerius sp. APV-2005 TaxID=292460 RepID=Q4GXB9_9COLE|nr:ribosomal protein L28e [Sphaerius sp. APV-2005]
MSSHLNWLIVRNNNAFLLKKRNINKPFSMEPNNLKNLSSYRYSGIVRKRVVGVEEPKDKNGFVLVTKKSKNLRQLKRSLTKRTMKSGLRRSLNKLKKTLKANGYRQDLLKAALQRATAIKRSQKPLPAKKQTKPKKTE